MSSLSPEKFREKLLKIMDQKDHWAWPMFMNGQLTKDQLLVHFRQEYAVYVRDFPVFLARVLGKNPPILIRRDLAENLYEEETGGLSAKRPHPELFLFLMEGFGFSPGLFEEIKLLPEALAYRSYIDQITLFGTWIEAAALSTIFIEGSKNERVESAPDYKGPKEEPDEVIFSHPFVRYYKVDPRFLVLKRVHLEVEGSHRVAAWRAILEHAKTEEEQNSVFEVMQNALTLWQFYRDGVLRKMGIEQDSKQ